MRILFTKPTVEEIENLEALKERNLIPANLRLVGISHDKDETDYSGNRKYLDEKRIDWITLERLHCEVAVSDIRTANGCTEEFRRLFLSSAGVIFSGGADIPPSFYGEKPLSNTKTTAPNRHAFEVSFMHHLLVGNEQTKGRPLLDAKPSYLVLGICLGMQTMNVALGGALVQDIPSQIYGATDVEKATAIPTEDWHKDHFEYPWPSDKIASWVIHQVRFNELWKARGFSEPRQGTAPVVSIHHQGLGRLGEGLEPLAASVDGKIVEAVGHRVFPNVIGVQWHPEKKRVWNPDLEWRGKPVPALTMSALAAFHEAFWRGVWARLPR